MKSQLPYVLIITRKQPLRDSLRVLLASLSQIASVEVALDVSSNPVEKDVGPPALVFLALDSADADSETRLTLHQIKETWPAARTAVLVEDERQHRVVQMAGADTILFEGITAAKMLKHIDALLSRADL